MTKKEFNDAQDKLKSLLNLSKIDKVIYIDDQFEKKFKIESIQGWIYELYTLKQNEIAEIIREIPFTSNFSLYQQQIAEYWGQCNSDEQIEFGKKIARELDKTFVKDDEVSSSIDHYFHDFDKFMKLSPSEWTSNKKDYLFNKSSENKILFFIDQDLSGSEGFASEGPRSGIGIIKDLINDDSVICCLLTHKIESIDNEMVHWQKYANENQLSLGDFLPLSKKRLVDGASPMQFVDGIKKALLNTICEKWKDLSIQIIKESNDYASNEMKKIDVYDFDHMVFQISRYEGIWEIDTFLRIHNLFAKDKFRSKYIHNENIEKYQNLLEQARPLNSIETKLDSVNFPIIRPIRRKEIFEEISSIKYLPLELGDIFHNPVDNSQYMLLYQPCDLMIRNVGDECGKRNNESLFVPLSKINRIKFKDYSRKPLYHWNNKCPIEYFFEDSDDVAEINFTESILISTNILDLSVLDPEGLCRVDIANTPEIPAMMTVGWNKRCEILISKYKEKGSNYKLIIKSLEEISSDKVKEIIKAELIDYKYFSENDIFNFQLQRCGRYRRPYADGILQKYSQYLSREATNVDFTKKIKGNVKSFV